VAHKVICDTHGESEKTYVCKHLADGSLAGLGFNRRNPTKKNLFPDAWCDDCEIIHAAHGGWTEEAEKLTEIVLLCSGCYERSLIRNTRPAVTLSDLAGLRWQCGSCDKWHTGPALDFAYNKPHYWDNSQDPGQRWTILPSGEFEKSCQSFLDKEYCAIDGKDFFVRGLIFLPIIGDGEALCWGVWGSLSEQNFEALLRADQTGEHVDLPPMFSWLSSRINEYPETLNMKMYAHIQKGGSRPHFRLEPSEHPLAKEFHHGIAPERVKEIMFHRLPALEQ
jgi:hypothetical protein